MTNTTVPSLIGDNLTSSKAVQHQKVRKESHMDLMRGYISNNMMYMTNSNKLDKSADSSNSFTVNHVLIFLVSNPSS